MSMTGTVRYLFTERIPAARRDLQRSFFSLLPEAFTIKIRKANLFSFFAVRFRSSSQKGGI
jgi:hypothetical protein